MERGLPLYQRRISAPMAELMSLAEAKLYLRVDNSHEDLLISELIVAVRMFAEDYLSISLAVQNWQVAYDVSEQGKAFKLPMQPVQQIIAVHEHVHEQTTPISLEHYSLQFPDIFVLNQSYSGVLTIDYTAGIDALNQPVALKQAMLAHIAMCYERRGDDLMQPLPAHRLYEPYKRVRI